MPEVLSFPEACPFSRGMLLHMHAPTCAKALRSVINAHSNQIFDYTFLQLNCLCLIKICTILDIWTVPWQTFPQQNFPWWALLWQIVPQRHFPDEHFLNIQLVPWMTFPLMEISLNSKFNFRSKEVIEMN